MAKKNTTAATDTVRISVIVPSAIKDYINAHYKNLSDGVTTILRNAIADSIVAKCDAEKAAKSEPTLFSSEDLENPSNKKSNAPRKRGAKTTKSEAVVAKKTFTVGEYSDKCWYVLDTSNEDKDVIAALKEFKGKFRKEFTLLDNRPGYFVQKSKVSLEDLTATIVGLGYNVADGKSVAEAQAANAEVAKARKEAEPTKQKSEKKPKAKDKAAKQKSEPKVVKMQHATIKTDEFVGTLHGCSKTGVHKTKADVKFYAVPNEDGLYYYQLGASLRIAMCLSPDTCDWLDLGLAECDSALPVNCGGKLKQREQFNYIAEQWHAVAYQDGKLSEIPAWVIEAYASVNDDDCKAVANWLKKYAA